MSASDFLPDFTVDQVDVNGIALNTARCGTGRPVLLLHGHPQTMIVWRKMAPQLAAAGHEVILLDLRGYGDSDAPKSTLDHATYSKRAMANDCVGLMQALGHDRFAVVGHDRGARVGHRLALDHPNAVTHLCALDIAPTKAMYDQTSMEFARRYFWWFFLIQPAPFPETLIGRDPEFFLRRHLKGQMMSPDAMFDDVFAEYLRCYRRAETISAICEDYRAAASIDMDHDTEDRDRKVKSPVLALWGAQGVVGQLFDVLKCWEDKAEKVEGRALECGHALPEEASDEVLKDLIPFLRTQS